ncbi:MAG: hypothetical protein ACOYIQ_00945 [Christensenellales bacterium]|jgi:hypothetical protein
METRRAGKKPKRYISGKIFPIFSLVCLILMLACLFLPLVSGPVDINGIQTMGGLFDNPYNPLSFFGKKGAYYRQFIQGAELDPTLLYAADVYRFAATLAVPALVIVLIALLALAIRKVIKEIKDNRVRASVQYKYIFIFLLCLGFVVLLPGLQIEYMEETEEFKRYFLRYLLFTHTYRYGAGLIVIGALSFFMAFLPVVTRLFIFAFTRRDVRLE